jgi:hypothetical protein
MLSAFVRRLVLVDVLFDVNTSDGIVDAVLDVAEVIHFSLGLSSLAVEQMRGAAVPMHLIGLVAPPER